MFELRKEHVEAFDQAALDSFEEMAEADLRLHNPSESASLTHEKMLLFIRTGIA